MHCAETQDNVTGYLHPGYAQSLAEFGAPRQLPHCGAWILQRRIPGFPDCDGMGCYPLFACRDWSRLHSDLEILAGELVTLSLVADPFGDYEPAYLQAHFDKVLAFKEHFIVDLSQPADNTITNHHRYYARRAMRSIMIEVCSDPLQQIEEWMELYSVLIARHHLKGIKAFSKAAFVQQLSVPGIVMFRAVHQNKIIGAHLWYVQGEVAYSHLEAVNLAGYKLRAAYALYGFAVEWFAEKVRWLDLGAGAGISSDDRDGLSHFKKGWSNGTRTAYFCSRIFDHRRYVKIVKAKNIPPTDYFPAYRQGEFE